MPAGMATGKPSPRSRIRQFLIQDDLVLHQGNDHGTANAIFCARKRTLWLHALRPVKQRHVGGGQTLAHCTGPAATTTWTCFTTLATD